MLATHMTTDDFRTYYGGRLYLGQYIASIASRHGFRPADLRLSWHHSESADDTPMHLVNIATSDGAYCASVAFDHDAMVARDGTRHVAQIELALAQLWRDAQSDSADWHNFRKSG
ncbi:MAG: hypothetical protein ABI612_23225 [Betaproteobacteria bacterium]